MMEVGWDSLQRPGLGVGFEPADQQPPHLFAAVDSQVGIAQHRQVAMCAVDVVGEEILMLHGDDGDADADHPPDLIGPHAGRVDDDRGPDRAPGSHDRVDASVLQGDTQHRRLGVNLHPPAPRTAREREGHAAPVHAPVGRHEDGTDHVPVTH